MTKIIPLKLSMSNAFLLRDEKSILVDAGRSQDLPALTRQLAKHGLRLEELALLILTHAHFDHAGSAAALQRISGCPVLIHQLEKDYLARGKDTPTFPVHPLGRLLTLFVVSGFAPVVTELVIENTLDLAGYGVQAQVIFTPGHTLGSISVITGDRQAIVGDLIGGGLLLGQFQPEKPRHHYWAVSQEDVQASLKRVFSSQPNKIYVGHGGPLEGQQVRSFFAV